MSDDDAVEKAASELLDEWTTDCGYRISNRDEISTLIRAAERRGAEKGLEWAAEYCDEMYDKATLIKEGMAALYPNETESA